MYFNFAKSIRMQIIDVIGTEITIPHTPKIPPPMIIEIKMSSGLSPVLSPISFGASILFSTH